MESIRQTSNGGGSQVNWTISRNGDLILNMFLEGATWDLSPAGYGSVKQTDKEEDKGGGKERPAREFLNSKLDSMRYSIEIGGQCIDRFDNLYRRTFNCLNEVNPLCDEQTVLLRMEELGIYNLPFWFCRNPGLALPLIALQYHEVKFILELNKAANDPDITYTGTGGPANDLELWVDYAYLDTDERRRFAQVSHEYLIEQVQTSKFCVSGACETLDLNFNHPVKELVWVCLDYKQQPTWHNIKLNDSKSTGVQLNLNGQDRFARRVARYFSQLQVWQYHSGYGSLTTGDIDMDFLDDGNENKQSTTKIVPEQNFVTQPVYVYSFALKPEEHQPSGTCNFSRIDSATLNFTGLLSNGNAGVKLLGEEFNEDRHIFNLSKTIYEPKEIHVFAINYNVLRIMSGMGGLAYSN
tara:strand:- start:4107 stop:5336 length:1230 start_codon:yes stop_codon:yes gene_type:complete